MAKLGSPATTWQRSGFMQLDAMELLGTEAHTLLHRAASVAAALLALERPPRVAKPAWVGWVAFPFPGEAEGEPPCADEALNRLVVADRLRTLAEELLGTGSDGVRLVTSHLLVTEQHQELANNSVALSLCPHSSDSSQAMELLMPLTQTATSTGTALVLVRKFDPAGAFSEAATASSEFMHAHQLALRTVLRRREATHIQCDSSQQAAPGLAMLLRGLSPSQRTMAFGFPLPGHPYWDRGTVAATMARYSLDPSPYLDALPHTQSMASDAVEEAEVEDRRTSAPKPEGWVPVSPPVWQQPEQALPLDSTDVLTPAQIRQWREHGWLVLDNIWPSDVIAAAAAAAEAIYPKPTPSADAPIVPSFATGAVAQHERDFPFSRSALNEVVLHPRILRVAAQLLGTDGSDVRFYGDVVLGKYGVVPPDGDQDLHLDFGNNTMLVPPASTPETVNVILNYSEDALETDGATRFVAERGLCPLAPQPGGASERSPLRDSSEDLYGRERAVRYRRGSCLLYRLDLLHRGSPVLPGKVRWTHHTNYKRADCEWIGRSTWARNLWELEKSGLAEGFTRFNFMKGLSCTQRAALGMTEETQNRERMSTQNGGSRL